MSSYEETQFEGFGFNILLNINSQNTHSMGGVQLLMEIYKKNKKRLDNYPHKRTFFLMDDY